MCDPNLSCSGDLFPQNMPMWPSLLFSRVRCSHPSFSQHAELPLSDTNMKSIPPATRLKAGRAAHKGERLSVSAPMCNVYLRLQAKGLTQDSSNICGYMGRTRAAMGWGSLSLPSHIHRSQVASQTQVSDGKGSYQTCPTNSLFEEKDDYFQYSVNPYPICKC